MNKRKENIMAFNLEDQMTNEEKLALYKSLRREYLEGKLCKVGLEAFPEEYEKHRKNLLEHLREIYDESYIDYASS